MGFIYCPSLIQICTSLKLTSVTLQFLLTISLLHFSQLTTAAPSQSQPPEIWHNNLSTLRLVQIIFRHGDRQPDKKVDGAGSLTDLGKKQTFHLGQLIRQRYRDPLRLKNGYDPAQLRIISSDKDRTIQSALTMAYGLYEEFHLAADWNEPNIPFEPIPIRTIPGELDWFLRVSADCPREKELRRQSRADAATLYRREYSDLIDYYRRHTGEDLSVEIDAEWISKFNLEREELIFNKTHNLTVPDWTLPLFDNEAYILVDSEPNRQALKETEYRRLYSGPLIQLLLTNLEAHVEELSKENVDDENRKLIIYSGHDRSLFGLLISLNLSQIRELEMPQFASALMIELHRQEVWKFGNGRRHYSEPHLKFWYRNATDQDEPQLLQIPQCGDPCSLEKFKQLTKDIIPDNFMEECKLKPPSMPPSSISVQKNSSKLLLSSGNLAVGREVGIEKNSLSSKSSSGTEEIFVIGTFTTFSILMMGLIILSLSLSCRRQRRQNKYQNL